MIKVYTMRIHALYYKGFRTMSIKKAELHVHLEGTIPPELARTLAKRNNLVMPEGLIAPDNSTYLSNGFMDFLRVYDTLAALIKTPEDYYDITFDYLRANALDDTIYVEMMYSPDHAEMVSGIPSIEHLHAIQSAIEHAAAKFGIIGRVIITAVRHFGADAAIRVAKQAAKYTIPAATGFGLGGDEVNFPPKLFKRAYEIAVDAGLSGTVHAGEFAPASGMLEAIQHLPIKRIGHGVQAMHSPETIALLKERNIALEICPSSNLTLGLFNDMHCHPFPQFLEQGLAISINSDDPPFMGTSVAKEYERVQTAYGYSNEIMTNITRMAIEHAFITPAEKEELYAKL